MEAKRQHFKHKIHIALCLLGLIPYLLAVYLFIELNLSWSETISLFAMLIFIFHFSGFYVLQRFSNELQSLIQYSSGKGNDYSSLPINPDDTEEVFHIKNNFNSLLHKLKVKQEKFQTVTIGLLKESRKDSQEYQRQLKSIRPYVDKRVIQNIMNRSLSK